MYIPPEVLQRTDFPEASGEDLLQDIGLIEEAWDIHFPTIQYFQLDKRTTSIKNTDDDQIDLSKTSGESGASKFDTLWGESIDASKTTWVQPQGTDGDVVATDPEVFKPAVAMRARVRRIIKDMKLEKYGIDSNDKWIGGVLVIMPCSLLDKALVTCISGDKLLWDTDYYLVVEPKRGGWWKSTNVPLYVTLVCEHLHHGS